jgi:hypothetical protein
VRVLIRERTLKIQKAFHTASVLIKGTNAHVKLFTVAAVAFVCVAAEKSPQLPVTFISPCECRHNHGKHRWSVKNDQKWSDYHQGVYDEAGNVIETHEHIGDFKEP